jgi:hypothetical protein
MTREEMIQKVARAIRGHADIVRIEAAPVEAPPWSEYAETVCTCFRVGAIEYLWPVSFASVEAASEGELLAAYQRGVARIQEQAQA